MENATKRPRGRADYEALLAERGASGQTLRAFAESRGIKPATLYCWSRRLRAESRDADVAAPSLVRVDLTEEVGAVPSRERGQVGGFELTIGGDRVLSIPSGFDAAELGRLLSILERR